MTARDPRVDPRPITAWGGFSEGKLHWDNVDDGWGGYGVRLSLRPAIFRTRKEAKAKYQDVRKITIISRGPDD